MTTYNPDNAAWPTRTEALEAMARADRPAEISWTAFDHMAAGSDTEGAPEHAWWSVVATDGAHEIYLAPVDAGIEEPWEQAGPGLVWVEL